jgi:hypothetical protein
MNHFRVELNQGTHVYVLIVVKLGPSAFSQKFLNLFIIPTVIKIKISNFLLKNKRNLF